MLKLALCSFSNVFFTFLTLSSPGMYSPLWVSCSPYAQIQYHSEGQGELFLPKQVKKSMGH